MMQSAHATGSGAPAARLAVLLVALGAVAVWAGTPAVTKLATGRLDPLAIGFLRTLLAGVAALPLLAIGRLALPRGREARVFLGLAAVSGFVVFPLLFSIGVARTSAGHAALLIAVSPIFTALIAAALERRLPGRRWWLGGAVALAGVVLLIDARFGLALDQGGLAGNLLVMAGCVAASLGYVAGARAAREIGTWATTLWALALASLLLALPSVWLLPWPALMAAGWIDWSALLYLSVLASILGYALWYWALAQDDIGRTGMVQFLQPFLGLLIAAALLGEAVSLAMLLAGGLIVAGVALAQSRRAR